MEKILETISCHCRNQSWTLCSFCLRQRSYRWVQREALKAISHQEWLLRQVKINWGELIKISPQPPFPWLCRCLPALQDKEGARLGSGPPNLTSPAFSVILLLFSQSQCYGGSTLIKWVVPWRNRGFALRFLWVIMKFQAGEKVRNLFAELMRLQLKVLFYRLSMQAK